MAQSTIVVPYSLRKRLFTSPNEVSDFPTKFEEIWVLIRQRFFQE